MTGKSIPIKESWPRLKPYYKSLVSKGIMIVSFYLMWEHYETYNGFDLLDFFGHEYYALGGIILVFLWNMKWSQWKELRLDKIRNWFR